MENARNSSDRPTVDVVYDQDLIVVYRALDAQRCRAVIDFFDRDESRWRGKVVVQGGNVTHQQEIKSSWDLEIPNQGASRDLFQAIHPKIQVCLLHYLSRSPVLQSFKVLGSGYKIQMYPRNEGYFRWHADSIGQHNGNRVAAMILYLNDVEKGGETEFFHQRTKISPKAGHLVMFPTGWNYMHCGQVPESADKYIIQSFITISE
jgi:2OG-Fe(II) oxygenase superfamily